MRILPPKQNVQRLGNHSSNQLPIVLSDLIKHDDEILAEREKLIKAGKFSKKTKELLQKMFNQINDIV